MPCANCVPLPGLLFFKAQSIFIFSDPDEITKGILPALALASIATSTAT